MSSTADQGILVPGTTVNFEQGYQAQNPLGGKVVVYGDIDFADESPFVWNDEEDVPEGRAELNEDSHGEACVSIRDIKGKDIEVSECIDLFGGLEVGEGLGLGFGLDLIWSVEIDACGGSLEEMKYEESLPTVYPSNGETSQQGALREAAYRTGVSTITTESSSDPTMQSTLPSAHGDDILPFQAHNPTFDIAEAPNSLTNSGSGLFPASNIFELYQKGDDLLPQPGAPFLPSQEFGAFVAVQGPRFIEMDAAGGSSVGSTICDLDIDVFEFQVTVPDRHIPGPMEARLTVSAAVWTWMDGLEDT